MANETEIREDEVVRGGLQQKQKKKRAGQINPIKALYISLRSRYRIVRKYERKIQKTQRKIKGNAALQTHYGSLARAFLPSTIEEFNTHLEFGKKTLVRSLVFGISSTDSPSYPPDLTANTFNQFQNLAGNAKLIFSSKISKIPSIDAEGGMTRNWRDLNVEVERSKIYNPGGAPDMGLSNQLHALRNNYDQVWSQAENSFNTQTIISIKGKEQDVLKAESLILSGCSSSRIAKWPVDYLHAKAWIAALPSPNMDADFIVPAPSVVAACLVASTNVNTPNDDTGILLARNRLTGANVIFDPKKLGAFHGFWFGATRSGKTFSAHLFLLRLWALLKFHIIYISRKQPDTRPGAVTDYEAVANFLGEEAATVILGGYEHSINPLHVLCNPKLLDKKSGDYSKAWDDFRRGISLFFRAWFEGEFSTNFEGMLEDTLDYVYDKKKIDRNEPKTWLQPMPTIADCRRYWWSIMIDRENQTWEDRRTAGAFFRKTRNAKPGGSMGYLLGDKFGRTSFSLDKEWITIDLHKVDSRIQDALYVSLTTALSVYYNFDNTRETLIFIDEARALLRNEEMSTFIMDTVTMGGTKGVGLVLSTQQPEDLIKSGLKEELTTNTFWAVVMGYGLDKNSAKHVQKFFSFSDSVMQDLLTCNPGDGVFVKGDVVTPVRFEAVPLEDSILKNTYREVKPESVSGYRIKEAFLKPGFDGKNFIEKNGFIISEMLDVDKADKETVRTAEAGLLADGWFKHNIGLVTGGQGSTNLFYREGDLDIANKAVTRKGYGSMSLYHLHAIIQKAVYIINRGRKAEININDKADVIFEYFDTKAGKMKVGAIELEMPGSHDHKELIKKWGRLIPYDAYRFITTDPKIFNGTKIPAWCIIKTGKPFVDWIEALFEGGDSGKREQKVRDDQELSPSDDDSKPENVEPSIDVEEKTESEEISPAVDDSTPSENDAQGDSNEAEEAQKLAIIDHLANVDIALEEADKEDASELTNDIFLMCEEDIVGEHLFGMMSGSRQEAVNAVFNGLQLKLFKRKLAVWLKAEHPDLAKPIYEQARKWLERL